MELVTHFGELIDKMYGCSETTELVIIDLPYLHAIRNIKLTSRALPRNFASPVI